MEMQLSMVVLDVGDLATSMAFYSLLGLDLPEPHPGRPVVIHRMGSGVSLVLAESFAAQNDPEWVRPQGGYQQLMEFYVGDDAAVDEKWREMTSAGCRSRMAPTKTSGPYAAMIDDPDGNVVLLTSDAAAQVGPGPATSPASR